MTLVMYDSIDVSQYAGLAMDAAAGYVDGNWQTFPTLGQHVPPGTHLLSITVFGNPADCVDSEPGNIEIQPAADWIAQRIDEGHWRPVAYCSASDMSAMIPAIEGRGIALADVRLWSAHYTYSPHICAPNVCGYPAVDGTQWTNQAHGRNLDQSELEDSFFTQSQAPSQPAAIGDDPMMASVTNPHNGNQEVWEINSKGELWQRVFRPNGTWDKPIKKGTGYVGSPSGAVTSGGVIQILCMRPGGVDCYWIDTQVAGARWQKSAV
jgi:hypothetical protein